MLKINGNKRLAALLAVGICIAITSQAQTFLTNGLVAYYPFNGNANDASGNGNNGTIYGGVTLASDRFGRTNSAYLFDGSDGYVDIGMPLGAAPTSLTETAWINILARESPSYQYDVLITQRQTPNVSWSTLAIGCSGSTVGIAEIVVDCPQHLSPLAGTSVHQTGSWFFICGVLSNNVYQIYVNGNLENATIDTNLISSSNHMCLMHDAAWGTYCNGLLNDVRIYNRALSSNEVAQLYAYESVPAPPPSIVSQPVNETVNQGNPVAFSVTANGTGLTYQWQFNSTNISGATTTNYYIASATPSNSGNYAVVVSNAGGSITSSNATLIVIPAPYAGSGAAELTGSFVTSVDITDGGSGYTNTPLVRFIGGGGSGAGAFAVISNGVVISITVTNAGYGYTNAPLVVIDPPFISNPVLGIAPMAFLSFSNLTVGGTYQLQQFKLWYWTNQPVSFTATNSLYTQMVAGLNGNYRLALMPVPTQAFATAQLVDDFVVAATVTSGGSGYITSPAISIVGRSDVQASGFSSISGGVVTSITITNAGYGYTNTPTIQIAPPPAAAVSPTVFPVMRVDSASLAPYDNYQIQFLPLIGGSWANWNGGLYTPTATTNSQFIFITNGTGFFRVQYVP